MALTRAASSEPSLQGGGEGVGHRSYRVGGRRAGSGGGYALECRDTRRLLEGGSEVGADDYDDFQKRSPRRMAWRAVWALTRVPCRCGCGRRRLPAEGSD